MGLTQLPQVGGVVLDEVRVRRVANQSIPSGGAGTNITWDTEDADASGFITVPSTTFTVPAGKGGVYTITTSGAFPSSVGSARAFLNLSAAGKTYRAPYGNGDDNANVGVTVRLAAADTVIVAAFQSSGGPLNFTGSFEMFRLFP